MQTTKHTPGPWRWTAVAGGWDGVKQENGPLICKLVLNEPENARLIAAAPELLGALKLLEHAASFVALEDNSDANPEARALRQALLLARAAIAKATQ